MGKKIPLVGRCLRDEPEDLSYHHISEQLKIGEFSLSKTGLIFSTIVILLGTFVLSATTTPANGQSSGTVCIIPTSSSSCPSSPATIHGTMGTQARVSVFIQTTPPMNAFEITLLADHTILKPTGVDLNGSILGANPTILQECLQGVRVTGTACPATDTIDTLHLVAVTAAGNPLTPPGASGLLFTATYNVTASTTSTPLGYQTGCSNSSVSGTTICVDIANGGMTAVPENVQTAVFTTADFTMSASLSSIAITRSSQAASTITLTSLSGFTGTISLSTSVSPITNRSPTATLGSSSVTLVSGGSNSTVLTISTPKNAGFGSDTVVVTGSSGSLTHTITISVTVVH